MSEATVLAPPIEEQGAVWVELDGFGELTPMDIDAGSQAEFIELDSVTVTFDSQEAMRFGARAYTSDQAGVIHLAMRNRQPLRVAPLPLDDE
jgi:hypothetical protein